MLNSKLTKAMRHILVQGDVGSLDGFIDTLLINYPELQIDHIAVSSGFMPVAAPPLKLLGQAGQPQVAPCNVILILYTLPNNERVDVSTFGGKPVEGVN